MMVKYEDDIRTSYLGNSEYLSVDESLQLMALFFSWNSIDRAQWVEDWWAILTLERVKVNIAVLQGDANAGKSLILQLQ
jgi:hypothetical protein